MEFALSLDQLRAVGEETRLRIVALLRHSDLTVSELVRCLDQLQPRVSRHLKILVSAGIVAPYQEGSWRFYRLASLPPWLATLIDELAGDDLEPDLRALQQILAERAEKAQAYFAENAAAWDAVRRLHADDHIIERAMLDIAPATIDRFLDLGTGTGRMLTLFAERFDHGIGYDASPEMLAVARTNLDQAGLRSITLRRRDILKPDQVAAESADVVCFHHVLHFLAEPERAMAVAAEALSPGGSLIVADFAPHTREELRDEYAHRRLGFGSDEMVAYAREAGLELAHEKSVAPGTPGGLTSMIWRFDKSPSLIPIPHDGAVHA